LREELGVADEDILIGIVGRLTEIKNHALFLRVARICLDHIKLPAGRLRFAVIGDGHLRGQLEQQAKALHLDASLVFLGNRNDPENFYPGLDIVALTSLNEGTPLSLIEAMANGRPVISTAVGGVVDLLGQPQEEDEGLVICPRGLRVASGDTDGLVRGLQRLIDDLPLRRQLGQRGEQFIRTHYSKERLLADMAALYDELLSLQATPASGRAALAEIELGKQVIRCAS
jgi:glycosyltransferase involved in cell wall biosynthesis